MSHSERGDFIDFAWSTHPVAAIAVGEVAAHLRDRKRDRPDVMFVFITRPFAGTLEDIAPALRKLVSPTTLIGCSASQIFSPDGWLGDEPAIGVFVANYGEVDSFRFERGEPVELDPGRVSVVIGNPDTALIPPLPTTCGGYTRGPMVLDDTIYMDGLIAVSFPAEADVSCKMPTDVMPQGVIAFADVEFLNDDHEERPFVSGFVSSNSFANDLTVFGSASSGAEGPSGPH